MVGSYRMPMSSWFNCVRLYKVHVYTCDKMLKIESNNAEEEEEESNNIILSF